jgi:hypothetical protein
MGWGVTLGIVQYRNVLVVALMMVLGAGAMGQAAAGQKSAPGSTETSRKNAASDHAQAEDNKNGLVIEPPELPETYPHGPYQVGFHARGNYVPVLHWSVVSGALPPGIVLEDNGTLHGEAQRAGEFRFVVVVRDGGQPQQAVQKEFVIKVVDALTVAWKVPAHVNVNRIEGSVQVTNATVEDMDFTFEVKAVAENGRATEIGYQHFPLKRGTIGMVVPFGETLPPGAYAVYVDVNGEIAARNAIYKQELRMPGALRVAGEP